MGKLNVNHFSAIVIKVHCQYNFVCWLWMGGCHMCFRREGL